MLDEFLIPIPSISEGFMTNPVGSQSCYFCLFLTNLFSEIITDKCFWFYFAWELKKKKAHCRNCFFFSVSDSSCKVLVVMHSTILVLFEFQSKILLCLWVFQNAIFNLGCSGKLIETYTMCIKLELPVTLTQVMYKNVTSKSIMENIFQWKNFVVFTTNDLIIKPWDKMMMIT